MVVPLYRMPGEGRRRGGLSGFFAGAAARVGATIEQVLFPSRCRICRTWLEIPGEKIVCGECLASLRPEESPFCLCCGAFFDGAGEPHICGSCLESPPPFACHRSFGRYRGVLKDLILLYKFRGASLLGPILAGEAYSALGREEGLWWEGKALVPVPLHPKRERERGFNQSALLARELASRSGLEVVEKALVRTRNVPPQSTLEAVRRARNVRGIFDVKDPDRIRGRVIVLVDDVYTTGATIKECAMTLLKAGAAEVRGITLARA